MEPSFELFDLEAVAVSIDVPALRRELERAVRQASSMSSVKNDLQRAREMMDALKIVQTAVIRAHETGGEIGRHAGATVQALFSQSVLLYVRATHTGGRGRNKLHVAGRLDPEGLELHRRLVGFRDQYLAHYDDPGAWECTAVVLALHAGEAKMALSYPHNRYYLRADEAGMFDALLRVGEQLSAEAYTAASERLNLLLNRIFEDDPDFIARLREHPFDPNTFFTRAEVESYLEGIGSMTPDTPTQPRLEFPDERG